MKAKLFSTISLIIASAAILASCTPTNTPSDSSSEDTPEAEVVSISQVTGWDYESSTPVLEGQLVRIEDAVVTSTYSATSISVAQYVQNSDTDVDISAVEVVLAEENDGTYDIKDIVTIEGTVTSTNGRPQIVDATIQWGAAGQETCDYHQNEQGEWVGGGSLWYSGINSGMERSWFDTVTRADSSKWYEFDVQFVTVPTVTAGQEAHYWIVFPGENTDLTDENNYSPIDVTIPALTEAQATVVNEWASQFEAGDFFSFFGQVWFNNYASLIQPYASWRFNGTNLPVEIAGLYTSWDDAAADLNTVYSATFPNFDFSSVFSWRVSHLTGTDGNPFAYVVANVTDGETSFLTDFFHVNEAGTGIELDTYESQGWYYAGLFQDSNTNTIFVDLYNDELTDETSSSTATTLVEISYSTSTVELYVVALSEEGYVDNGGSEDGEWTTYTVCEYYANLFKTPLKVNELPASYANGHYVAFGYGEDETVEGLLADCQLFVSLAPEGFWEYSAPQWYAEDEVVSALYACETSTALLALEFTVYWSAANGFSIVQIACYIAG